MSVLSLENVSKRYRRGHRELVALRSVSLEVENGEVVCVSGGRASGRTTLLRIVAGSERPDEGHVRFAGTDLARASGELRRQIAVCNLRFLPAHGRDACDHVAMPLRATRVSDDEAGLLAHRALERVGAGDVALTPPHEWIPSEAVRVSLARAIVREPRLLIFDEPTNGVDPTERDDLLLLIQRLAHESGIATLLTAGDTASVTGADRVMRLSDGELLGRPPRAAAEVVELRRPSASESTP
ncbi:MAG: ATP-binding cassette domain-containing protein [Actinobacteria bacterium]|nr:ATP-binding cassette domain-containing protein [Actinomycetota bacterium]